MAPRVIDKWLHVAQDGYGAVERRYRGRGGMQPKIIVLHIQEGSNTGSWQWFHTVTASATVLIGKNGDVWRLVPEEDAPWTNGDVISPTPKGVQIMNQFGWDPNYYSLTIETEGFTGEYPKAKAQIESVVWQIRTWMDRYNIPLERVIRHADINQGSRSRCPGDAYYKEIIGRLQNGGAADVIPTPASGSNYADPVVVMKGDEPWDGKADLTVNGVTFYGTPRTVTVAVDGLNVRQWASGASGLVRAPLTAGEKIAVLGWVKGQAVDGEDRWWVTKYGSRIWAGGTTEKPARKAVEQPKPDTDPVGRARVVDGHVFYPLGADGAGRAFTVAVDSANLRQYAGTGSRIVGTVAKGTKVTARYYTEGERVNGEDLWLVLAPEDEGADPLVAGARLSVTVVDGRPY